MTKEKTVLNEREKLMDFLDNEGKQYTHSDISGGYETVYILPLSLKEKFWDLYNCCLWNSTAEWVDSLNTPPTETVGRIVTGDTEFTNGAYRYRRRGYDEDGFYQKGEEGVHNAECHITFHTADVYAYYEPWGKFVVRIDRDHYAGGEDISKVTVCFVR